MIDYKLQSDLQDPSDIRLLVEQLRTKALELPFKSVGELVELRLTDADYENCDQSDPLYYLLMMAKQYVETSDSVVEVKPKHIIAFSTNPGDGCTPACFGLVLIPTTLDSERHGWSWIILVRSIGASSPD